jgi:hypothetical protein
LFPSTGVAAVETIHPRNTRLVKVEILIVRRPIAIVEMMKLANNQF